MKNGTSWHFLLLLVECVMQYVNFEKIYSTRNTMVNLLELSVSRKLITASDIVNIFDYN